METDSIEAPPSAEQGNVPAEAVAPATPPAAAPSEAPPTATPAAPRGEATTPPAEAQLFELPDGRKVDAATLSKEWTENFMPEFTRKSQALAKVGETINPPVNQPPADPWADPSHVPQNYREIINAAKTELRSDMQAEEQQRIQQQQAVETLVAGQITEIKGGYKDAQGNAVPGDATLNENALFQHAVKYGFRDLKAAHQNMRDMAELAKKVSTTTAQNIQKRNDPVSITPGASGTRPNPANFSSATEFLRSLQ